MRVVERFASQGYQRMKIKNKPGRDLAALTAVRRAMPDVPIMADVNSAYTLADTPVFQAMDELNLMMYEQPLTWDDVVDHAKLQQAVRTPVCLDESVHSPEARPVVTGLVRRHVARRPAVPPPAPGKSRPAVAGRLAGSGPTPVSPESSGPGASRSAPRPPPCQR